MADLSKIEFVSRDADEKNAVVIITIKTGCTYSRQHASIAVFVNSKDLGSPVLSAKNLLIVGASDELHKKFQQDQLDFKTKRKASIDKSYIVAYSTNKLKTKERRLADIVENKFVVTLPCGDIHGFNSIYVFTLKNTDIENDLKLMQLTPDSVVSAYNTNIRQQCFYFKNERETPIDKLNVDLVHQDLPSLEEIDCNVCHPFAVQKCCTDIEIIPAVSGGIVLETSQYEYRLLGFYCADVVIKTPYILEFIMKCKLWNTINNVQFAMMKWNGTDWPFISKSYIETLN